MKRKFTKLMAALALLVFTMPSLVAWGQTRTEVTLWSENFDGLTANATPTAPTNSAYTGVTYTCTDGTGSSPGSTKIMNENLAGGASAPELMVGKKGSGTGATGGKFTVNIPLNNYEGSLTLTYYQNKQTLSVSSTTDGVSGGQTLKPTEVGQQTTSFTGITTSMTSITIVFQATTTSNVRLDDIVLTGTISGGTPTVAAPTFSPANGATFEESLQVTLSQAEGKDIYYNINSESDPDANSTHYTGPFSISATSTIKAIAIDGENTSSVATATYTKITPLANIAALTANTETGTYYVTLDEAVVTYVNGNYAYIQDESGAVVMYKSSHGLTAGDVLNGTATVAYQLRNGNPQITNLSGVTPVSGTAPDPTTLAASAWNYIFNNVLSQYFKITGATITQSSGKYYISLNNESIQLYKASGTISNIDFNRTYTITGFPTLYNTTKELQIFVDPVVEASTEPTISVNPSTVDAPFAGVEGTLTVTYEHITTVVADVYFCNAAGEAATYDWVTASVNSTTNNVDYLIEENDGEARTAYLKVWAYDDDENEVYSDIVTINQDEYVAPTYAELPFEFNGGRDDIENTDGLYQEGLGTDYNASTNPNTQLKFDGTGDWLLLQFSERPGTLTFDIKGNSFSGSTFKVQTSENGSTFTDLKTYTSFGSDVESEEFTDLGENVRYIKWIYTNKSSGNVGLGNITLAKYVAPVPTITVESTTISATAVETEGTLNVTYTAIETSLGASIYWYTDNTGTTTTDEPSWISAEVNETTLNVDYMIGANDAEARTAYFKVYGVDGDGNDVYSDLVTVNQAAPVAPPTPGNWVSATLAELTPGDVFVIVGTDDLGENYYAMSNNNGTSAPSAISVNVADNTLSGTIADNIQWNLTVCSDGYTFYPAGSATTWLYCISNNNGLRVSDGNYPKVFIMKDNYLYNVGQERYVGIYNSQDWRSYTSINSNIANQTFAFYKKVSDDVTYTKDITAYEGNGGYTLIASPVCSVTPSANNGFLTNAYDLYYFDQSQDQEWRNHEAGEFNLTSGKGYLYANSAATQLTFTGQPYNGNGVVALDYVESAEFAGWNLIGNPFAQTTYITNSYYTIEDGDNGSEVVAGTGNAIQAMQGIFVVATAAGQNVTFSTTPAKSREQVALNVMKNRGTTIDRAIVRFDEGDQLPKFQLNPNNTKIYVTEGNQDFAVVRSAAEAEMPVSFKAAENGTYTLNIEAENVEMNYLHLIDNMTGMDVDLLQTPSYTFEAKTNDYTSRFRLVFSASDNGASTGSATFAYYNGSNWTVSNLGEATLQVVDVTGRMVSNETISGNATVSLNQPAGVYMMRLVNGNSVKVQKVVVR